MAKLKVRGLVFNPATCSGISRWMTGRKIGKQWYESIGHGFGENLWGSQLYLAITINRKTVKAWVDHAFKEKLLAINPRVQVRRVLLEVTAPKLVAVKKIQSRSGADFYRLEDEDLKAWLERIAVLVEEQNDQSAVDLDELDQDRRFFASLDQ